MIYYEKFEESKGITRNRKSKKDRQCNGQKKKGQTDKTNNDVQNTTQKTEDLVTRSNPHTPAPQLFVSIPPIEGIYLNKYINIIKPMTIYINIIIPDKTIHISMAMFLCFNY